MLLKARIAIREAQKKKRIVSREGLVGFMMEDIPHSMEISLT